MIDELIKSRVEGVVISFMIEAFDVHYIDRLKRGGVPVVSLTVAFVIEQGCRIAIETLVDCIHNRKKQHHTLKVLEPHLICRTSCGSAIAANR